MKKISILIMLMAMAMFTNAQELETEIGYLYTKAKYLLETNRSSEAVEVLTKIISQDAHYKEAMALRANAKYQMGDNKKARKDIIKFIEENGLTPNAVRTLALINYADKDYEAASNSLYTAALIFPRDLELLEKRAEVLFKNNQLSEACVAWHDAAKLGSKKAKKEINKNCYSSTPPTYEEEVDEYNLPTEEDDDYETPTNVEEEKYPDDEVIVTEKDETKTDEIPVEEEEKVEEETYDITDIDLNDGQNKWLKLDEELSINILGGGLGDRKIKKMPNILLLTDEIGTIVMDLCIGKNGQVLAIEYNAQESSMDHRNNREYLLRKTKDLEFESASETKCGRFIYNINK